MLFIREEYPGGVPVPETTFAVAQTWLWEILSGPEQVELEGLLAGDPAAVPEWVTSHGGLAEYAGLVYSDAGRRDYRDAGCRAYQNGLAAGPDDEIPF